MHTGGTGTPLTYWGVLCFLTALILFAGCASRSKAAKNNGFCPTFLYEGQLVDSNGTSPNISISLMTLLDSTIVGSYYYDTLPSVTYSLGGKAYRKDAIRHKDKVLRVDFENRGWTSLPAEMAELTKLESVNLLGNNIDTFPPMLAQMKNIFYLSLCSNKMKYIGPEIGEMTNLRVLIINMNQLHCLPKEIGNLTNLMYLEIGSNPIDSLPEEIKNLTKLQVLHIDNWQPSSERFSDEYKQHLQDLLPNCRIHFDKNDHIK